MRGNKDGAGRDRQQAVLRGDIHAADPVLVWGAFPALCFLVQYNGQRDENRDQALISNWIGRLKITSRKFCKRLVHSSRMNRSGQELYQAPIFKLVTQNYFLIPLSALRFLSFYKQNSVDVSAQNLPMSGSAPHQL